MYPTGWTHPFKLTIDHTKVTGTPAGFVMLVDKSMLPASVINAGSASAQDGGGDLRFSLNSDGTGRLAAEVVDFHPDPTSGNRRCEIWLGLNGHEPNTSTDLVIYGWCKGPATMLQPAPSQPYGAEAVWSPRDYRAVHHMNAAAAPEQYSLWLIRPRAVEYSGATYVTWLDASHGGTGNIRIAKYNHATGLCTQAVTVTTAEMIDAHAAPSLCVDTSGYLHIVWGGFSATNAVLKTVKSTNPGDISAWGSVVTIATGGGATDRTYPTMLCLSTGTLVLFARETDAWVRRTSTDNGATWGNAQTIVSSTQRSYTEWILGASDRVHVGWHTTATSGSVNGLDGCYFYCDNASAITSTWKAVDGTTASLPIASDGPTTVSTGRVFSTTALGFNTSYLRGLSVNASNEPMLSFDGFVTGTPASSAAMSFKFNGTAWVKVNIATGATIGLASSGSFPRAEGGVRYLTGTTWRALIAVTVSGVAEVQEWESINDGGTWAKVADVSSGSSLGNWLAQYVRGATGPIVSTHFVTGAGNKDGAVFNSVSDSVWCYGSATDGVAAWLKDLIAGTTYLRDSTAYHNDATAVGTPSETTDPTFGKAQAVASGSYYVIATNSTVASGVASNLHIEGWFSHTSSGSAEKSFTKNPSAGNSTPYVGYRNGSNNVICFFGNGSAFTQPAVNGVGATLYRLAAQFFSGQSSVRVGKTGSGNSALTAPLAAVSDHIHIGEDMAGKIGEFRIAATQPSANALDTEFDNQSSPGTFAAGADLVNPVTLSATSTCSAVVVRNPGARRSATSSLTASRAAAVTAQRAASAAATAQIQRAASARRSATATSTASLLKARALTLLATVTTSANVARAIAATRAAASTLSALVQAVAHPVASITLESLLVTVLRTQCPRVFPETAPWNTPRPYVIYEFVGGPGLEYLDNTSNTEWRTVQLKVWADGRLEANNLMRGIESAMRVSTSFQASPRGEFHTGADPESERREARQDFSVFLSR